MNEVLGGSFRDPAGFVFQREGRLYRQVNRVGAADYDHLMASGLYARLVERGLLVAHEEVAEPIAEPSIHHRTLRPERVPFVSYPYEWCFGQLRDAALLTLEAQRTALDFGATLRDATAYNVQFRAGKPVWIDTLSFARRVEGTPWVAYKQFCQHFLAPLALMSRRDVRLGQLLRVHLDGIPLDLAASLLPWRARLRPGLYLHLVLHGRLQRRYAGRAATSAPPKLRPISTDAMRALVGGLERAIARLDWRPEGTTWADYDAAVDESYTPAGRGHKQEVVGAWLRELAPERVLDLGANVGEYSRMAAEHGADVISFDGDPACVERSWREVKEQGETRRLPLLADLANPAPSQGFAHRERDSFAARSAADLVLALALVHHLAIGDNVPLERIAAFFAELAPAAIVEFVPKGDTRVRQLLASREDVFADYDRRGFEAAFGRHFRIEATAPLRDSERILYRMRRIGPTTG